MLAALDAKPDMMLYSMLDALSDGAYGSSEVYGKVCSGVRPLLDESDLEGMIDFIETCEEWVDSDLSLLWSGAKKDIASLPALHRKLAAEDAEDKAFHQEIAKLFPGGGACTGSNCGAVGWRSLWDQEVESLCVSHDCFAIGWDSSAPDGVYSTRCIDGDCLGFGWRTKSRHGTWVSRCNDEDCSFSGWTTTRGSKRYVITTEDEGSTYTVVTPSKKRWTCESNGGRGGVELGMSCAAE